MNGEVKPINAVLIGAGRRGNYVFGKFAKENPNLLKFVAVVERDENRKKFFSKNHNISTENQFSNINDFIKSQLNISVAINSTSDKEHFSTTIPLIENNYHILLEKPISNNLKECEILKDKAIEKGNVFMVCHVLRYAPFFSEIKKLIENNVLGKINDIELIENIGNLHFSHSYVRGNWNNSETSGPISLTKTCHDFDIISWLLNNKKCINLRSFSGELFFQEKNRPGDVPNFCSKGCNYEKFCEYHAQTYYLDKNTKKSRKQAVAITEKEEDILGNLKAGPYGRCVYKCDNNVVDNQTTELYFEENIFAKLIMDSREKVSTRKIRITGEKGELKGSLIEGKIFINSEEKKEIDISVKNDSHGGGDSRLIQDFLEAIKGKQNFQRTIVENSTQSHFLAFLAEESRKNNAKFTSPQPSPQHQLPSVEV